MNINPALWQLISPTLPIGAYSYSQGLESAIDQGWVDDQASAAVWIQEVAEHSIVKLDIPILMRCYKAVENSDQASFEVWNQFLLANRETKEFRLEDTQMGSALLRLLDGMDKQESASDLLVLKDKLNIHKKSELGFASSFALVSAIWKIELQESCAGYLWAWYENQVAAAIKLVPLGQTEGQKILRKLTASVTEKITEAEQIQDHDIGSSLPGLCMASSWHETQYTRLFRS